jgi:hypothetical protein
VNKEPQSGCVNTIVLIRNKTDDAPARIVSIAQKALKRSYTPPNQAPVAGYRSSNQPAKKVP